MPPRARERMPAVQRVEQRQCVLQRVVQIGEQA